MQKVDFTCARRLPFLAPPPLFLKISPGSMATAGIPNSDFNRSPSIDVGTARNVSSLPFSAVSSNDLEAHLSPFLLHHSVNPTTALVTQPLIGASNYGSWSKAILLALSGRNKLGFINGSIKRPDESQIALFSAWQCNNDIIMSWIINSVSKEIAASLVNTGCVKDAWDQLKKRYKQTNGPRVFQLRKDLVNTT